MDRKEEHPQLTSGFANYSILMSKVVDYKCQKSAFHQALGGRMDSSYIAIVTRHVLKRLSVSARLEGKIMHMHNAVCEWL